MKEGDQSVHSGIELGRAPLLSLLDGSVMRSAPVSDAPCTNEEINAHVEAGRIHVDEAAIALALAGARRATFVAGRLALRDAVRQVLDATSQTERSRTSVEGDLSPGQAILRTDRGAPHMPADIIGSITHKQSLALALAAPRGTAMSGGQSLCFVGVDLERRPIARDLMRRSIAQRILTSTEFSNLETLDSDQLAQREWVHIHFAIKEAVYKAIDPLVHRYVSFMEVELAHGISGAASGDVPVLLLLPELADTDISAHAQWHLDGNWIVATAFTTRAAGAPPLEPPRQVTR